MSRKGKRNADRQKRIQAASAKRAGDSPREFRILGSFTGGNLSIQAEDGDNKMPRFSGNAYTGAPMKPEGWFTPIICDLKGFRIKTQQRPVLRQHDHLKIVGHTETVTATSDGLMIEGPMSGVGPDREEVVKLSRNAFPWQLSIGANPVKTRWLEAGETETVNGREVTGPLTISDETELGEISFVPLGADGDTSARIAASKGQTMNAKQLLKAAMSFMQAAKYNDDEIEKMSEDDAKAALKKCMSAADDDEDEKDKDKDKADAKAAMATFHAEMEKMGREMIASIRTSVGADMARQTAITAAVNRQGVSGMIPLVEKGQPVKDANGQAVMIDLAAHAIKHGWTEQQASDAAELHQLRAGRPGPGVGVVPGGHFHFGSDPVMNGAVLECAVFDALRNNFRLFDDDFYTIGDDGKRRISAREQKRIQGDLNASYPDQIRQAAHTRFKGQIGLKQLLAICASASGYRGSENWHNNDWGTIANHLAASSMQIRADGPSSVNTPATLANVQNKFMLQGYLFTEQTYMDIAHILPVKDLKPTKSVQLFGDFQFQQLAPGGEIQHASVGDNPYDNQAVIKARMITLDLQYIINDDLGMFGQVPMMLGRGWGLDLNHTFWTEFMNPGNDEGGSTAFYAATHTIAGQSANSNLSSGSTTTLTSEGLRLANVVFANQIDPAGKPLGIDPELLVYPPELDNAALELMNAQFIVMAGLASTSAASKQPNTNIWKGRYKPLMSRYLNKSAYTGYSTVKWYLLANPSIMPVFQIAALNGQMTPTIQTAGQDWQFNQLGISMRGWGGFGVNKQNFRGVVRSEGA